MRSLPWRAPGHQSSARELGPAAPKGRADLRWDHAGGAQNRRRHDCHASSRTSLSVAKHYFTREYYREAIRDSSVRERPNMTRLGIDGVYACGKEVGRIHRLGARLHSRWLSEKVLRQRVSFYSRLMPNP